MFFYILALKAKEAKLQQSVSINKQMVWLAVTRFV